MDISTVRRAALRLAVAAVALPAAARAAGAGEPRPVPARAAHVRFARAASTNVIDESLFTLAEFFMGETRTEDAVAVLERVARESPDRETRSMAHFNLATIHETTLDDPDRARVEYAKVTGLWAGAARGKVLQPLRAGKRWAEAADFLKECLAACEEPSDKAEVVRMLVGTVRTSGDAKLIESTLRSVPELITYEEAQAAAEADRRRHEEIRRRAEAEAQPPLRPGHDVGRRPDAEAKAPTPGHRPPGAHSAEPPPVRARSPAELEAQIRELERAGFNEEAHRLREELGRLKATEKPEQF